MRKLIVAAAVAAVASLGLVGRANAQAFYPGSSAQAPTTRGTYDPNYPYGAYPSYPAQYPSQYPSASQRKRDDDHDRDVRRRDEDRDRDRRPGYGSSSQYDQRSGTYGYPTRGSTSNAPARVTEHTSDVYSRGTSRTGQRDSRYNDSRDRR
jgi:hypothetical protein